MPYRAEFPWISNRWAPAANHGPAIGGPGQPIRDRQQVGPCSQSGTSSRWAMAANKGPATGGPRQPIRDQPQVGHGSQSGTNIRWAPAANQGPATGGPWQPIKDQQQVGLGSQSGTPRRAAPPIPANAAAWWRRIKILACMGGDDLEGELHPPGRREAASPMGSHRWTAGC
jgi:hypothetical protein